MDDFEEQLQQWVQQIANQVELTPSQKASITKAGADVFRDELEETTRQKHYSNHDDKVYGHMADHITATNKDVDGDMNGVSTVGWDNKYHAMNAMRLNDGTVKIKADHFVTNLQNNHSVQQKVLIAEQSKLKELTQGDE